ncbi:hypothetical protein [Psychromicrobium sp. YIM B11713]|uniref:hypothetical protein n=1 Tax=Psychromicrobium sp. YIM B11713 TaxID=3145233 RepID=UPI00374EF00A
MRPHDSHPESDSKQLPAIHLSPSVEAKLSDAAKESLARQQARAMPGGQSVAHGHKPTHASGKQGRRERKVRW